jgi:hypothetical protein
MKEVKYREGGPENICVKSVPRIEVPLDCGTPGGYTSKGLEFNSFGWRISSIHTTYQGEGDATER